MVDSADLIQVFKSRFQHPDLQAYHIPGQGRSYVLPGIEAEQKQIRYFFHISSLVGPRSVYIAAPTKALYLSFPDLEIMRELTDPFDIEPFEPRTITVESDKLEARREAINNLKSASASLIKRFPDESPGSEGAAYLQSFELLVPDVLKPYYKHLSPEFWEWLNP